MVTTKPCYYPVKSSSSKRSFCSTSGDDEAEEEQFTSAVRRFSQNLAFSRSLLVVSDTDQSDNDEDQSVVSQKLFQDFMYDMPLPEDFQDFDTTGSTSPLSVNSELDFCELSNFLTSSNSDVINEDFDKLVNDNNFPTDFWSSLFIMDRESSPALNC